jgi:hypothetical protein
MSMEESEPVICGVFGQAINDDDVPLLDVLWGRACVDRRAWVEHAPRAMKGRRAIVEVFAAFPDLDVGIPDGRAEGEQDAARET